MDKIQNINACGIDISTREHVVAIPKNKKGPHVRTFNSFTKDLKELVSWLKNCGITTVAMESTGVYWYHLFTMLLDNDIEVVLLNAYHVKNIAGRKSDINDAEWIQQLHSFGLLRGCFQPDNLTRSLRDLTRQRKNIIYDMTRQIQRMKKSMELMNIKLQNVISDITGISGMNIINAILEGQRCPKHLSQLVDKRMKKPKCIIENSLEATWREQHLFTLKQAVNLYNFLKSQLSECDQEVKNIMNLFDTKIEKDVKCKKPKKNQPDFNVEQYLLNIHAVNVFNIPGISSGSALTIFSETGPMLKDKFPTEKQFLSWLNVVPDNDISGGKVLKSRVKKKKNKAGQAFREAANTLWRSNNHLGNYLRGRANRKGSKSAIVATARKLASIYYKMITQGVEYNPNKVQLAADIILNKTIRKYERKIFDLKLELAQY